MPYQRDRDPYDRSTAETPARIAATITPADSDLPAYAKGFRVMNEGAGVATVRVTYVDEPLDATTVDLKFPVGLSVEPSHVRRIWATGTTGTITITGYLK